MNLNDLNEIDLSSIDLNNLGTAPTVVRGIFILLFCALILGAGYALLIKSELAELEKIEKKELEFKKAFEEKQKKAANLEAYKSQLDDMRRSFGTMLKQLPSKTEIEGLIVDISQTALSTGLEIETFQPKNDEAKGFYIEQPYDLKVYGSFHELGAFSSGVAALPRIVTLHDIKIQPSKNSEAKLVMNATIKTYRYQDGS